MYIGGIDSHTSIILSKIEQRTISLKERIERKIKTEKAEPESYNYFEIEDKEETDTDSDVEYVDATSKPLSKPLSFRNTQTIPNIAMTADRYGVSNRATAAIATATLIDFGLITPEDQSLVTDKNKVARARQEYRSQLQSKELVEMNAVTGIYFDGRHDKTLSNTTINGKCHTQTSVEEHIVVIDQNSTYLFHTTPESGHGINIASSIYGHLQKHGLGKEILSVGSDGTNVNVGWKNGSIVNLERMLGRGLQWAVCLLHTNELPLRHLFEYFDGKTIGPNSFSGPIGKSLKKNSQRFLL